MPAVIEGLTGIDIQEMIKRLPAMQRTPSGDGGQSVSTSPPQSPPA